MFARKISRHFFSAIVVVVLALVTSPVTLTEAKSALSSVMAPVTFNTSPNADVVINRTGGVTDNTQVGVDGDAANSYCYLTQTAAAFYFPTNPNGLPDNGFFAANAFHPDVQLAVDNSNGGSNARKITPSGPLTFTIDVPDDRYHYVHIFGATGNGISSFNLTFNYSDATSTTTSTVTLHDWYDDWVDDGPGGTIPGGAPSASHYYLVNGLDRMQCNLSGYQNANDPAIFGHRFASDVNKILQTITVTVSNLTGGERAIFFGATGVNAASVTINQAAGQADPTSASPINFTVVFSEPVSGFATGDVTLGGTAGATTAIVSEIAPNDGTTYNVAVSGMTGNGTVTASIAAGVATDGGGNGNLASTSSDNSVTYNLNPTVTINKAAAQPDPTNVSPINFTVVFSEPVTGFTTGDVTLSGTAGATTANVTEIAPNNGTTYNVEVSGMANDGTVIASVPAGVAQNAFSNTNLASTSTDNTVVYDTTGPIVTIDQAAGQADPTNASPINFTVVFSEPVTGFTTGDVTLSGTAGATTGTVTEIAPNDGTTYNVAVSGMTGDGTVIATIAAGVANDLSGIPNNPSSSTDNTVYYLDANGPGMATDGVNTTPDTGNGILSEFEVVTVGITQFSVKFNQPVYDPAGDTAQDDVTNPANYMLIRDLGNTAGFQTVSCLVGAVVPDDTQFTIGSVTYDNATFTATFTVNSGLPLTNGTYRLYVCGTTSIVDPLDNALSLVGSGGPNSDFIRNFIVNIPAGGGGGGGGGGGNAGGGSTTIAGGLIPVTGFAPNSFEKLPEQPSSLAYSDTGGMRLEIPSIGVNVPIVGVKQIESGWDLTWLGGNAGYLEGSAYPTWQGNTVLTAHVLDTRNAPGPFAYLNELKQNDVVYIHAGGQTFVYKVEETLVVPSYKIKTVFKHEEYSWLTLVTCENYSDKANTYLSRRVVRAVLISVVTDK